MQLKVIPSELLEKADAGDGEAQNELAKTYDKCEFVVSVDGDTGTAKLLKAPANIEGLLEHSKDDQTFGFVVPGRMDPPQEDEPEPQMPEDKKERIRKIVYEVVEAVATGRHSGDDRQDLKVNFVDFDKYGTLVAEIYGGFNGCIADHSAYYCTQWAHLIELLGFWGVEAWLVETWIDCSDDLWTLKLGLDTKEN